MHVRTTTATRPTRPTKASSARARRAKTIANPVNEYLIAHQSEGHSPKTLEWHSTALGLLLRFLEAQEITDPREVETSHLREWVVWLGKPESMKRRAGHTSVPLRGKRTIQTYVRSAHAFGKWLYAAAATQIATTTTHRLDPVLCGVLVDLWGMSSPR
jgi:hypothetical protein